MSQLLEKDSAFDHSMPAYKPQRCSIKKIVPCVGTIAIISVKNGQDTQNVLTIRQALERAEALSQMRDKLRFADERAKIQNVIEELLEACRVAREKQGDAFLSPRVSFAGAMYKDKRKRRGK